MKIAYLGPKGSFSHHVVQTAFPHEELQAFANITDVIKAYEQGLVDYSGFFHIHRPWLKERNSSMNNIQRPKSR